MQSELVVAAAKTGAVVNIKHGQFMAPENMAKPVKKIEDSGNDKHHRHGARLHVRLQRPRRRSAQLLSLLDQIGYPVVFDAGHSIRKYGIPSKDPRGSARQFLTTLARSAVAAGVDGFFIEAHPNPPEALCDAASQYALDDLEKLHAAADRHPQLGSLADGALKDRYGPVSRLRRLQRDRSRARLRFHQGPDDDADVHASPRHHRHRRRDRQAVGDGARSCRSRRSATRRTRSSRRPSGYGPWRSSGARLQGADLERGREGVQAAARRAVTGSTCT